MSKDIFIVLICWGLWAFLEKLAVAKIHPAQIQIINCVIGLALIPVYIAMMRTKHITQPLNIIGIFYVVAASICATIASFAFLHVLKTSEVGTTTVISSTYPAITVILGAIFLGEAITVPKIIGMLFVFGGVALLSH